MKITELSREALAALCEYNLGMAVYDDEPTSDLREAVADSLRTGDLTESTLHAASIEFPARDMRPFIS